MKLSSGQPDSTVPIAGSYMLGINQKAGRNLNG